MMDLDIRFSPIETGPVENGELIKTRQGSFFYCLTCDCVLPLQRVIDL